MGPCNVKVCRICFAMDCELHVLHENIKLYKGYEAVTGLILANEDGLPPYLCTKCADRQTNFVGFMNRSLEAHMMLLDILRNHGHISVESIQAVIKTNHFGSVIEHTEKEKIFNNIQIQIKHEDIPIDPIATELGDEIKIEFNPDDALVGDEATVAPCVVETNDIIVKEEVFDEASVNDYLDDGQSNGVVAGSDTGSEYESSTSRPSTKKKLLTEIVHKTCVAKHSRQDFKPSETQLTENEMILLELGFSKHFSDNETRRIGYNHTMTDQPDEPMDFKNLPLLSKSNVLTKGQEVAASTSATPLTEPPAAPKSYAQKQREYRQRMAATRTPAQLITARKLDAERQRNCRIRKAAKSVLDSASLEVKKLLRGKVKRRSNWSSTTATSNFSSRSSTNHC